jgi:hypothetical protein
MALTVDDLWVGAVLADGGVGRVFELPLQPHLVYKSYRKPQPPALLEHLAYWPATAISEPGLAARVGASAAWPTSVVLGSDGLAVGLLLPRAPRRFAVRHRDGAMRLSSLSYLTSDPAHRAAAYGLSLPPPASPARFGIAFALARLLEVFESAEPKVGHGDLSTKNVLWSLQRGPEVFVIDCDNCERFDADGLPLGLAGRRRAMTPNWDDPAVGAGGNPTLWTDRYSLALIFLRVVGAANFPVQARQRQGGPVSVDFYVPRGSFGHGALSPGSPVWDLCESGLGIARPDFRPSPAQWAATLEEVLAGGGAKEIVDAVQATQGGPRNMADPSRAGPSPSRPQDRDVVITPVVREPAAQPRWEKKSAGPPPSTPWFRPYVVAGTAAQLPSNVTPVMGPGVTRSGTSPPIPLGLPREGALRQVPTFLRRFLAWWLGEHYHAASLLIKAGHRGDGLRAAGFCAAMDLVLAVIGLFLVGMIVAPIIGV